MAAGSPKRLVAVLGGARGWGTGPDPRASRAGRGLPSAQRSRRWPRALRGECEGPGSAPVAPTSSTHDASPAAPSGRDGGRGCGVQRPGRLAGPQRECSSGQAGFFPLPCCSSVGSPSNCEGTPVGGPGLVSTGGSAPEPTSPGSHRLQRGCQEHREALGQLTASRVPLRAQGPPWPAAWGHG